MSGTGCFIGYPSFLILITNYELLFHSHSQFAIIHIIIAFNGIPRAALGGVVIDNS
ncbi:hypothetical protein SAMN04488505_101986 [Chitinophaga rupis]|uniref:Uncharacterized protein n=1 Tax=Chitinophaga rupis TaxID=573321 RepID=A0A1H7KBM9_9BACT|nr:hypothetical protein SAMN04488505_101986 [Chitinophaga rupis]